MLKVQTTKIRTLNAEEKKEAILVTSMISPFSRSSRSVRRHRGRHFASR